jgi:hypothetical protein
MRTTRSLTGNLNVGADLPLAQAVDLRTIVTLARAVQARDPYAAGRSERVTASRSASRASSSASSARTSARSACPIACCRAEASFRTRTTRRCARIRRCPADRALRDYVAA